MVITLRRKEPKGLRSTARYADCIMPSSWPSRIVMPR
jgi:hypothetical protein